jgi:hypothetical protein
MTPDGDITPDDKDWTWVLSRPCPQCGYDGARVHPTDVGAHIRADATDWVARLQRPGVTVRPTPGVWSILEYGCHVRDVHRIFNHRVELMLSEDVPTFPNWDQDQTALADDYRSQDPKTVAGELAEAANTMADTYAAMPADAWPRRGLRSNGSEFTITSIARYHLHDIVHHTWDVTPLEERSR